MTSYPACNKSSLSRKPYFQDKQFTMEHYQEVMVVLSEFFMKVHAAPSGGGLTMTSYPVGNKASLYQKPFIADKKLYGSLSVDDALALIISVTLAHCMMHARSEVSHVIWVRYPHRCSSPQEDKRWIGVEGNWLWITDHVAYPIGLAYRIVNSLSKLTPWVNPLVTIVYSCCFSTVITQEMHWMSLVINKQHIYHSMLYHRRRQQSNNKQTNPFTY